jgi:putative transposase
VAWQCSAPGVSYSGFHAWLNHPQSLRALAEEELAPQMRSSFLASSRTYGARRVRHDVLAAGLRCGLHKIERLMRAQALRARPRRPGLPKDHGERRSRPVPPNILDRQFAATRQNQKWVADFTYVWTAGGWLYVAVVLELFSCRVVG